jgi:hypothetical protein
VAFGASERASERASTHATRRIHTHTPHSESQSERARERDARREVRGMLGKRAQHMRMCILVVHVALAFGRRAKAERAEPACCEESATSRAVSRELVTPVARVGLEDEPSECEAEGHNDRVLRGLVRAIYCTYRTIRTRPGRLWLRPQRPSVHGQRTGSRRAEGWSMNDRY